MSETLIIFVSMHFFHKDFRLCKPEFIYTLFYISNHKQISFFFYPVYDLFLHQIAVLIFINIYIFKLIFVHFATVSDFLQSVRYSLQPFVLLMNKYLFASRTHEVVQFSCCV